MTHLSLTLLFPGLWKYQPQRECCVALFVVNIPSGHFTFPEVGLHPLIAEVVPFLESEAIVGWCQDLVLTPLPGLTHPGCSSSSVLKIDCNVCATGGGIGDDIIKAEV